MKYKYEKSLIFSTCLASFLLLTSLTGAAEKTISQDKMHRISIRVFLGGKSTGIFCHIGMKTNYKRFKYTPSSDDVRSDLGTIFDYVMPVTIRKSKSVAVLDIPPGEIEVVARTVVHSRVGTKWYEAIKVLGDKKPDKLDLKLKEVIPNRYTIKVQKEDGTPLSGGQVELNQIAFMCSDMRQTEEQELKLDSEGVAVARLVPSWPYELTYKTSATLKTGPSREITKRFVPLTLKDKTCVFRLTPPKEKKRIDFTLRFVYLKGGKEILLEEFPGCMVNSVLYTALDGKISLRHVQGPEKKIEYVMFKTGEKVKLEIVKKRFGIPYGFQIKDQVVTIGKPGETATVRVVPRVDKAGMVYVKVYDSSGKAIKTPLIDIAPEISDNWTTADKAEFGIGRARVHLDAGKYKIRVWKKGFRVSHRQVVVTKGREVSVPFRLERQPLIEVKVVSPNGEELDKCDINIHYENGPFNGPYRTRVIANKNGFAELLFDDNLDAVLTVKRVPNTTSVVRLKKGRKKYQVTMPVPPKPIQCVLDSSFKKFKLSNEALKTIDWYYVDYGVKHLPSTRFHKDWLTLPKGHALLPKGNYYPCIDIGSGSSLQIEGRYLLLCEKIVIGDTPPKEIKIIPKEFVTEREVRKYR